MVEPVNGGTRFTVELSFGIRAPIIGHVVDAILRRVLERRLATVHTHMREEGEHLKGLLEKD